jgi:hypothetical protein
MFSFTHPPGAVNVVRLLIIRAVGVFAERVTRRRAQNSRASLSSTPRMPS